MFMIRRRYNKVAKDENTVLELVERSDPFEYFDHVHDTSTKQTDPEVIISDSIEKTNASTINFDAIREEPKLYTQKIANVFPVRVDFFNDKYEYDIIEVPTTTKFKKIVVKCFNSTITINNKKITCSNNILADLVGDELRIWTVDFLEKRKTVDDGESELLGYTIQDFDDKSMVIKQKIKMREINIDFNEVKYLDICGDFSKILFNENILDKKEIMLRSRHYNTLVLGNIDRSGIKFDIKQSDVISTNI